MPRKKVELNWTTPQLITEMSEGNPGALSVLVELDLDLILDLDDMNIRGPQIWVGYKDHCGKSIERFKTLVRKRDKAMVDTINRECYGLEEGMLQEQVRVNRFS
jgi:hypothetical protein